MPSKRADLVVNPPLFSIPQPKTNHANRNAHESARKFHLRRINDVLHLCLQRGDIERARGAFSVLIRCREIEVWDLWRVGLSLVDLENSPMVHGKGKEKETETHGISMGERRVEYLKNVVAQSKIARVEAMKELLLCWITMGRLQEAREYLTNEYLTTHSFFDSTVLQTYGGLICLRLSHEVGATQTFSQSRSRSSAALNTNHLRNAKSHFEQAVRLDEHNSVAKSFLKKLQPQFRAHGFKDALESSRIGLGDREPAPGDKGSSTDSEQVLSASRRTHRHLEQAQESTSSESEVENSTSSSSESDEESGKLQPSLSRAIQDGSRANDGTSSLEPHISPSGPQMPANSQSTSLNTTSPRKATSPIKSKSTIRNRPKKRRTFLQINDEASPDHEDMNGMDFQYIDDLPSQYGGSSPVR